MTEDCLEGEKIRFIFPLVDEVKSAGISRIMKKIQLIIFDTAVCGRDHASEDRISFIVILLEPEAEIIRQGFDNLIAALPQIIDLGILFGCNAVNDTDRDSTLCFSGNLKHAKYV